MCRYRRAGFSASLAGSQVVPLFFPLSLFSFGVTTEITKIPFFHGNIPFFMSLGPTFFHANNACFTKGVRTHCHGPYIWLVGASKIKFSKLNFMLAMHVSPNWWFCTNICFNCVTFSCNFLQEQ